MLLENFKKLVKLQHFSNTLYKNFSTDLVKITNTKLYVLIATLSSKDNVKLVKLVKLLEEGFKKPDCLLESVPNKNRNKKVVCFGLLWDTPPPPPPPPPPPLPPQQKLISIFSILSNFLPIIKNKMRIKMYTLYQQGQGKTQIINGCSLGHFYKKIFSHKYRLLFRTLLYIKKNLTNTDRSL